MAAGKSDGLGHHLAYRRRLAHHRSGNTGEGLDVMRYPHTRVHQALETIDDLAAANQHHRNLSRPRPVRRQQAGGFEIDDGVGAHAHSSLFPPRGICACDSQALAMKAYLHTIPNLRRGWSLVPTGFGQAIYTLNRKWRPGHSFHRPRAGPRLDDSASRSRRSLAAPSNNRPPKADVLHLSVTGCAHFKQSGVVVLATGQEARAVTCASVVRKGGAGT